MNITPLDIRKHEFKRVLRGYDVDEVQAFLDMVSVECENLINKNAVLEEKVQNFEIQLKKYHDIEGTLQETLLSAERAREETVKTAKKQAEVIVREAEVKAASVIEDGREQFSELRNAINALKVQKESYIGKLTALMNAQQEMFSKISFEEEENLGEADEVFLKTKATGEKTPPPEPPVPPEQSQPMSPQEMKNQPPRTLDDEFWETFD